MTREEILNTVQEIFRDIFDEDNLLVQDNTSPDDIEEWDSLNHIKIVSVIENEFKIKFALSELKDMKDCGAMIDSITEKQSE
jgi:acyl carrier protein